MPNYRRAYQPGGTFFLTLVTHQRIPLFNDPTARQLLHESLAQTRRDRPFELVATVLLPDHLHLVLTLPPDESDFSIRVGAIKGRFTRRWLANGGGETSQSPSRTDHEYRGLWQKRFWEHAVRDLDDLNRCCDYVHFNPVKHGLASCPHEWSWSTFHRFIREGKYDANWCCVCAGMELRKPPVNIHGAEMD
jgi:putative transposase